MTIVLNYWCYGFILSFKLNWYVNGQNLIKKKTTTPSPGGGEYEGTPYIG